MLIKAVAEPFCCSVDNIINEVVCYSRRVEQKSATYVVTCTPNSVRQDNGPSLSEEKWVLEQ